MWQRRPTLEALSEEGSEVEEGQARSEEPEVDSDSTGWSGRSVTKEPSATDLVAFARADGEEPVEAEKGAQETDAEGEDEIIPSQAAACKEGETENGREPEEEDEVAEEERLSDATSSDTEADASQEAQRASDDKGDGATEPKERDSPEAAPEKETSPNGAKSLATEQPESESESDRGAKVEPGADAALEALQSVVEDTATEKTGDSPGGKALEQDSEASAGQGVGEESVRSAADREAEEATESSKRSSAQARVESTPGLAEERPREEAQNEEESSEEETRESRIEEAEASPTESKDSPEEESAAVREAEAAPKVGAERADGSESSEESDARWEGCSSRQQVETEVTLEPEEASEGSRERIEGEREADACTDGQKSVVAAAAEERGEKELEARAQLGEEKETGLERSEESKSTAEGAENDTVKPSSAQQEASDACKVKVNSSEGENAEAAAETEQENAPESSPEGPSGGGVDAVRESERQAEAAVTPGSEVESGTGGSEASQVGLADAINDQKLPAGDGNGEEPAEKTRSAAAGADVREVELKKEETAEVASLKEEKPSVLRPEAESESTLRGGIPSSVLSMLLPHFRKAEGGSSSYGKTSQDQAAKEGARQPPRFAPKLGPPPGFEMHAKRENGAASRGQESGGGEGEIDDLLKVLIGGGSGGTEEGQGGGPERQDVSRARNLEVATKVETHLGQSLEEVEVARASVVGPDFWKEMLGLAGSTGAERGSAERGSAEPERKAEDGGAAAAGREAKEAREKTWEELFDEMQAKAARGEPLQKPDSEKTWEELEADGRFVIPQKRKTVPQQPPPSEDEWRVKVGSQIGVGKSDKPGEPLARAVLQEAAKAKKAELEKVKIKAWSKPEVFAPEEPPDQSEAPRGRDSTTRAEEEYLGEAKERGRGAIDGAAGVLSTVGR